jgi:hypothetical protein
LTRIWHAQQPKTQLVFGGQAKMEKTNSFCKFSAKTRKFFCSKISGLNKLKSSGKRKSHGLKWMPIEEESGNGTKEKIELRGETAQTWIMPPFRALQVFFVWFRREGEFLKKMKEKCTRKCFWVNGIWKWKKWEKMGIFVWNWRNFLSFKF